MTSFIRRGTRPWKCIEANKAARPGNRTKPRLHDPWLADRERGMSVSSGDGQVSAWVPAEAGAFAKPSWNTMRPSTFRVAMCSPKLCSTFPERMLQGIGNRRARSGRNGVMLRMTISTRSLDAANSLKGRFGNATTSAKTLYEGCRRRASPPKPPSKSRRNAPHPTT